MPKEKRYLGKATDVQSNLLVQEEGNYIPHALFWGIDKVPKKIRLKVEDVKQPEKPNTEVVGH